MVDFKYQKHQYKNLFLMLFDCTFTNIYAIGAIKAASS